MRTSKIKRETAETCIDLSINLDGTGEANVDTGIGFLDHMLVLFAKHSRFDLSVLCKGDVFIDDHHSTEDIAICLGKAIKEAIGDKRGIIRYGDIYLPMDESLILSAVDISGRGALYYDVDFSHSKVGTFDTELVEEFFTSLATNAGITLHIRKVCGKNTHHICEAIFKSAAHSLRKAVSMDPDFIDDIPSTKGIL